MKRRVVVTGLGVVCPLGNNVASMWPRMLRGESGVDFITEFSTEKLRSDIAARVRDFDVSLYFGAKEAEIHGKVTHFCVAAASEAMASAGLADLVPIDPDDVAAARARSRMGCLVSTGMGSVDVFEAQIERSRERGPRAVSPYFVPAVMPNAAAAVISIRYGLMGPSYNIASACATGTHSIAMGTLLIESGDADVMLVGGSEAATQLNTVAGFGNARALSRSVDGDPSKASRPFDRKRNGFVMGEGAGALVLEAEEHALARGAKPLAYVSGFGMTTDAEHLTRPHSKGLGLAFAVEKALARAGIGPGDVGYINPHATSTLQGDIAEYESLRRVFGEQLAKIPVSATKSLVGHVLGGAGAVESIAVVCSLRDQRLHPSINVDDQDPVFELDVVREARAVDVRYALKCSAGFGGHNAALVFERA